jgi:hypothetical protein
MMESYNRGLERKVFPEQARARVGATVAQAGSDVFSDGKETVGSGIVNGLLISLDPWGMLVHYAGKRLERDTRTFGGIAAETSSLNRANRAGTLGGMMAEIAVIGGMVGACANEQYLPYVLGAQGVFAAIDFCGILYRRSLTHK